MVKSEMSPNFRSGDLTLYNTTMAPMRSTAARKVLRYEANVLMWRPEVYPTLDRREALVRFFSCNRNSLVIVFFPHELGNLGKKQLLMNVPGKSTPSNLGQV